LSVLSNEKGKPYRSKVDTIQPEKAELFTSHKEAGQHLREKVIKKGEASASIKVVAHQQRLIAGFHNRVFLATIKILQEDSNEAVSNGQIKADIEPLVDVINKAIDAVGV
jgi:hypothetical protein